MGADFTRASVWRNPTASASEKFCSFIYVMKSCRTTEAMAVGPVAGRARPAYARTGNNLYTQLLTRIRCRKSWRVSGARFGFFACALLCALLLRIFPRRFGERTDALCREMGFVGRGVPLLDAPCDTLRDAGKTEHV